MRRWVSSGITWPVPPSKLQPSPADAALVLQRLSSRSFLGGPLRRLAEASPDGKRPHGNRKLHTDQLFLALLCAFYEPMTRSLRRIEDRADFEGRLDLPRLARSTTADALAACDPSLLAPVIEDLRARVPQLAKQTDLDGITQRIIAADGTYLTTLVEVAWALKHTKPNGQRQGARGGQVRANVQLDVASATPVVLSVSGDDGESEPAAFARDLLPGVLYVVDRNFVDFSFISAVLAKGSDLVLRTRANAPACRLVESIPLTAKDVEAGVIADQIVQLSGKAASPGRFRRVTIQTSDRAGKPQVIRLLTNLSDPSIAAHVIGAIYRLRWQIELFFKWLKTWARMDHLLSTSRAGITFQLYVAVIGVLLLYVQSGRRVSIYALAAMPALARGDLSIEQFLQIIARREREREMNNARAAARRARKKLA